MKSIPIEKLLEYLNYSDLRAVRKWCLQNDVFITDHGKHEFVIESNFFEAYHLPFINYLKNRFVDDWESVYRLHIDGNVPALNMLHEIPSVVNKASKVSPNKSRNNIYEEYLKKFNNYAKA